MDSLGRKKVYLWALAVFALLAALEEVQEILLKDISLEKKTLLKRLMQQMAGNIIQATSGAN